MATGRAIDHVVLAVRSLDGAAATYERLGFTLTPRAFHEDRMGTSNRLAQFAGRNFIELLEVDRPAGVHPHDLQASPPFFSFGHHARQAIAARDGLALLVFASDDARADLARWHRRGLATFAPFEFERQARLPDGSTVTVAFSLGFVRSPDMPGVGFFVCENRAQQYFWKPEYQRHANGARVIGSVLLATPAPERDARFLAALFDGEAAAVADGWRVTCGPGQEVRLVASAAMAARDGTLAAACADGPVLAGISIAGPVPRPPVPAGEACGMRIEWTSGA